MVAGFKPPMPRFRTRDRMVGRRLRHCRRWRGVRHGRMQPQYPRRTNWRVSNRSSRSWRARSTSRSPSIPTRPSVAARAVALGAVLINDVWGLQKDPAMADMVAAAETALVIMHNRANKDETLDIMSDIRRFFDRSLALAEKAGIPSERIILDPGIAFGKTSRQKSRCHRRNSQTTGLRITRSGRGIAQIAPRIARRARPRRESRRHHRRKSRGRGQRRCDLPRARRRRARRRISGVRQAGDGKGHSLRSRCRFFA